ncbi:hypothetical protein [Rufibacter hautae]|uniref:Uncharacterized protein n=1 Tax=Rufibacter hautae TaxID=2595005 RepID=A0A5B6TPV6_9BACT|nr:hypothetical protein [Rufibacter hautae]KAA3438453.1 hypothetical protein FOA19_14555 [Rufibacter hautae]
MILGLEHLLHHLLTDGLGYLEKKYIEPPISNISKQETGFIRVSQEGRNYISQLIETIKKEKRIPE